MLALACCAASSEFAKLSNCLFKPIVTSPGSSFAREKKLGPNVSVVGASVGDATEKFTADVKVGSKDARSLSQKVKKEASTCRLDRTYCVVPPILTAGGPPRKA